VNTVLVDHSKCTACRMCQLTCSMHHNGVFSPELSRVRVTRNNRTGEIRVSLSAACDGCPGERPPACVRSCSFGALTEAK
jgi:carbon-monoxide dehydrogenase iron sulfur subunit